jgi:hypothetical protein
MAHFSTIFSTLIFLDEMPQTLLQQHVALAPEGAFK